MIIAVIHPPSILGNLLAEIVRVLAETTLGYVHHIFADQPHSMAPLLAHNAAEHLFITGNAPGDWVAQFLIERQVRMIIVMDEPAAIVRFLRKTYTSELIQCIRSASVCLALVHDGIVECAGAVIDREILVAKVKDFMEELALFYGLGASKQAIELAVQRIVSSGLGATGDYLIRDLVSHRSAPSERQLSSFEARIVDACLGPFGALAAGTPVTRVTWPGALFAPSSVEQEGYDKVCDLTGTARILVYGPYLHLPRGRWVATPSFTVENNESGNTMTVDICSAGEVLAGGRCLLPPQGKFSCQIAFEITEPRQAIEVRFATKYGAIEGDFRLHEIVLAREFQSVRFPA